MSRSQRAGDESGALTLSEDPLKLRSARLGGGIQLQLRHQFRLIKDDEEPSASRWHVSTGAYFYQLDDGSGHELTAWHWHPATRVRSPHVHVAGGILGKLIHLPTGRVSIESVLWLLLTDLEVKPARGHADDFAEILAAAERSFIGHRRWHARGPGDEGA